MLRSAKISLFQATSFQMEVSLDRLSLVNLIVGAPNTGKSTLLRSVEKTQDGLLLIGGANSGRPRDDYESSVFRALLPPGHWLRAPLAEALRGADRSIFGLAAEERDPVLLLSSGDLLSASQAGDGVWRLFEIAIGLMRARYVESGSTFLFDNIDAGVHRQILPALWRLLLRGSRALGVQAFVTAPGDDSWRSLAGLAAESVADAVDVSAHRIERGRDRSVDMVGADLAARLENGIGIE